MALFFKERTPLKETMALVLLHKKMEVFYNGSNSFHHIFWRKPYRFGRWAHIGRWKGNIGKVHGSLRWAGLFLQGSHFWLFVVSSFLGRYILASHLIIDNQPFFEVGRWRIDRIEYGNARATKSDAWVFSYDLSKLGNITATYGNDSSAVQYAQRVALIAIVEKQCGHSLVVGSGGGASSSLLSLFTPRTSKKTEKATMRKLVTVFKKMP